MSRQEYVRYSPLNFHAGQYREAAKGDQTAQACANACFQHSSFFMRISRTESKKGHTEIAQLAFPS
jgi:hypothetical protein